MRTSFKEELMNYARKKPLKNGNLPDFLIVGAQKSGTTWLWKQLRQHDEVRVPPRKEIHFFDKHMLAHDLSWYAEQVADKAGMQRLIGEKTPCYAHLDETTIGFIKKCMPDVKIILILREPASRSWSQARMEIGRYNKREVTNKDKWKLLLNLGSRRNKIRSDYRSILERWRKFFTEEKFLVLFYEQLRSEPGAFYQKICDFLNVEFSGLSEVAEKREWESSPFECPKELDSHLRKKLAPIRDYVIREYPEASLWWKELPNNNCSWFASLKFFILMDVVTAPFNAMHSVYSKMKKKHRIRRMRQLEKMVLPKEEANKFISI